MTQKCAIRLMGWVTHKSAMNYREAVNVRWPSQAVVKPKMCFFSTAWEGAWEGHRTT